jgi:hypothetical protein
MEKMGFLDRAGCRECENLHGFLRRLLAAEKSAQIGIGVQL